MGMTSDQNEKISFAEMKEMEMREAKEREKKKDPGFTAIGMVEFEKVPYLLIVGPDKKWYKSKYIKSERSDELNNTPFVSKFENEITPVTEKEFYSYFKRK